LRVPALPIKRAPGSAVPSLVTPRSRIRNLWLVLGALTAAIAVPLWRPLGVAWHCYWLHEKGVREQAELMHKLENATFALRITAGPHAGQACTAGTSHAIFQATEPGAVLEVVYVDWKPGECELSSTIEASAQLLWVISGGLALLLGGILALGLALTRSFTRPAHPARRMEVEPRAVRCPVCAQQMDEGYLPILAGIHWRTLGEPVGLPHALRGLPGTVGWRGRPRLHAFRCVPCEIVIFQYGDPPQR
jgi:hypothetical protein